MSKIKAFFQRHKVIILVLTGLGVVYLLARWYFNSQANATPADPTGNAQYAALMSALQNGQSPVGIGSGGGGVSTGPNPVSPTSSSGITDGGGVQPLSPADVAALMAATNPSTSTTNVPGTSGSGVPQFTSQNQEFNSAGAGNDVATPAAVSAPFGDRNNTGPGGSGGGPGGNAAAIDAFDAQCNANGGTVDAFGNCVTGLLDPLASPANAAFAVQSAGAYCANNVQANVNLGVPLDTQNCDGSSPRSSFNFGTTAGPGSASGASTNEGTGTGTGTSTSTSTTAAPGVKTTFGKGSGVTPIFGNPGQGATGVVVKLQSIFGPKPAPPAQSGITQGGGVTTIGTAMPGKTLIPVRKQGTPTQP